MGVSPLLQPILAADVEQSSALIPCVSRAQEGFRQRTDAFDANLDFCLTRLM
jgi:hypothetical protein